MATTKWVSEEHNIGLVKWNEAWLLTAPYHPELDTSRFYKKGKHQRLKGHRFVQPFIKDKF